ncbi:MAG: chemotaxis protein CheR [Candidatus Kapabacteria bacterium]|nr:chemotaxis protein CheR [Ignavibacteriota bacterium]MCW5884945.1 chemotaxis protein CheR [Candidatus Kapabacteria bacterium]
MAFTFFFRDRHTLELLAKLLKDYATGFSRIKIWDAGSAMGPEPYTFAMIMAETIGAEAFKRVQIISSDIDEYDKYGETINNAVYPKSELVRMPDDIFEKYFVSTEDPNLFKIVEPITSRMSFIKHDLLTLKPFEMNFHGIICKNVLLHFQPEQRIEVFKMFHNCLEPGGFIVNEQTQQLPSEVSHLFEKAVPDANIYRKI